MALSDEQCRYLADHSLAVLATGRRDGTSQLSMVSYHFDSVDIAISVQRSSAKWRNARRLPRATLLVPDGRTQLVIEGPIDLVESDPERLTLTRRVRVAVRYGKVPAEATEFARLLDAEGRVVLRVLPERAIQSFPLYPPRPVEVLT